MAKKIPEEWSQHLTRELRAHFKSVGRALVEQDVAIHRYGASSKYYAALGWPWLTERPLMAKSGRLIVR